MASRPLRITYLLESTELWGGNKVVLEQAELLSDAGNKVTVLSKDAGPAWYPFKLRVVKAPRFDASTIPDSDIVIGTYWPTVKNAYEAKRGTAVHLCQGYEGGFKELASFKTAIDEVYSYRIPKLTVSPHMNKFLEERFNAKTYYIGQMLNRDIFYPQRPFAAGGHPDILNVLVIGPFEADVKNIRTTLEGVAMARNSLSVPLKLIRVSQFDLSDDERRIITPDIYHFRVPHLAMGNIYRGADLLVSMSKAEEGFGLPPLEAMGCGVPTILSRIPSHLSYDDPHDYALFVESDPKAVSEGVRAMWRDRGLRQSLSKRGLSVAARYTGESVLRRLVRALNEIVAFAGYRSREI